MAVAACQMTSLKVAQSPRVPLDNQAIRGCKAALSSASLGYRRGVVSTFGARLRAFGGDSWGYKSSCSWKFVVSAAVAEPASAIQAESGAPAEGLSMFFKAEGSMNENSISKVTKALEGIEGVSQIKVYVEEGAATVELVKQTDIQATGVASSLVETIVQAGFKMQALSLGFDDDGADDDEFIDYDPSSFSEEEEASAE